MKEFKDILRQLRKKKGLSQRELAQRIGASENAYLRWENGLNYPGFFFIIELAQALGCTTDELLLGEKP